MFTRKYVFETERTKLIRLLLNILLAIVAICFTIILVGVYIPMVAHNETDNANRVFYKKDPDLIAVYTGDSGRIKFALEQAFKYKTSKIFISGVYSTNSVQTLLSKQANLDEARVNEIMEANRIELDHVAKNTIENVISTFHHLRNNPAYKSVLIISNDYHIMRIRLIVDEIKVKKDYFDFYYLGIPTDYWNTRNIKILYTEVIKYLKAWGFLLLWDKESLAQAPIEGM